MKSALPLALLAALAACSSSSGGNNSVNGTVDGVSFSAASGIAEVGPDSSSSNCNVSPDGGQTCTSSSSGQVIAVALTNRAGISCGTLTGGGTKFANMDVLELAVGTAGGTVATGTYEIVAAESNLSSGAEALLLTTTANCGQDLDLTASSGTITLSQITATSVSGSYSVTFGSMGTFSGSFDEPICEVPDGGGMTSSGDGGVCQ